MNRILLVLLLLVSTLIIVIFWTSTEYYEKDNIEMTILPMIFARVDNVEEQFHGLCMGCHTEKQHKNENLGPMRDCARCHTY